jgi:predicted class III extradiol MEMO1 family dioxygenase
MSQTEQTSRKEFVVAPHHNLVNPEIDTYYKFLSEKYPDFENVVILSPNHFAKQKNFWQTFPEK